MRNIQKPIHFCSVLAVSLVMTFAVPSTSPVSFTITPAFAESGGGSDGAGESDSDNNITTTSRTRKPRTKPRFLRPNKAGRAFFERRRAGRYWQPPEIAGLRAVVRIGLTELRESKEALALIQTYRPVADAYFGNAAGAETAIRRLQKEIEEYRAVTREALRQLTAFLGKDVWNDLTKSKQYRDGVAAKRGLAKSR